MSFFSDLFKKNKAELDGENTSREVSTEENEDEIAAVIAAVVASMDEEEEIVAAITAAIACIMNTPASNFVVRNIKRTPEMDPIWAVAGRMKLMR